MGLDAEIYFLPKKADPDFYLPPGFALVPVSDHEYLPEGVWEVDCGCCRYYAQGYERGPWPALAAVLMTLIACPDVEKVWYGHDSDDCPFPVDAEIVNAISLHYMKVRDTPYRQEVTRASPAASA